MAGRATGRATSATVAPFTLLVPVFGIASAWLALGEVPTAAELLGGLVVLAGIGLTVGLCGPTRPRAGGAAACPAAP
jgi:O-acetylserine/cysteine efflux transporter